MELNTKSGVSVSRMVNAGSGVWVCYRGVATVELYHSGTQTALQQIDVQTTLSRLIASELQVLITFRTELARLPVSGQYWILNSLNGECKFRKSRMPRPLLLTSQINCIMDELSLNGHVRFAPPSIVRLRSECYRGYYMWLWVGNSNSTCTHMETRKVGYFSSLN